MVRGCSISASVVSRPTFRLSISSTSKARGGGPAPSTLSALGERWNRVKLPTCVATSNCSVPRSVGWLSSRESIAGEKMHRGSGSTGTPATVTVFERIRVVTDNMSGSCMHTVDKQSIFPVYVCSRDDGATYIFLLSRCNGLHVHVNLRRCTHWHIGHGRCVGLGIYSATSGIDGIQIYPKRGGMRIGALKLTAMMDNIAHVLFHARSSPTPTDCSC